ncbi:radical SAM protein [Candidatus Ruminimicrobium bovinum]|uniref:radical SAM protein n=1 Tax=Candidatus Ruminimicrobium bovinum TaxID=3242779 RepID=UPI0039B92FC2
MTDKIKKFIDCNFPVKTCNLRCHYCYITQNRDFDKELPKFKYSPEHIVKALSKERLGGVCGINICGEGETLLPPEIIPITLGLLQQGHYVNLITNGTITKRFEQLCEFPKDLLSRLFIKFSFQFLELKRLNLFETFVKNVHKIRNAKISFTIEITPNDELIPYIEEIKRFSIENFGALPHITVARNNRKKLLPILTNLSREEYKKVWNQFDSIMFDYKMKCFNVKRKEFCYAGVWTAFLMMGTGELKQCYLGKTIDPNIYEDINKKIDFSKPVGYYCPEAHCFNSHAWLAFGDIPEHAAPTYAQIRNRVCNDGTEWLQPKVKSFFSSKLCESNEMIAHGKAPSFIKRFFVKLKYKLIEKYLKKQEY